jgi:hypothetical protein
LLIAMHVACTHALADCETCIRSGKSHISAL